MISGLDSATPPSAAQADQAKAAGVRLWSGYLADHPAVGLLHPWLPTDFENARRCGGAPIAYCSGRDRMLDLLATAYLWNVKLCLDVERSVLDDGPWVDAWLNTGRVGLYGSYRVHANHRQHVPFRIMSGYPGGDPGLVWPADQPRWSADAYGWQYQGSHTEFGVGVDRGHYDDYFTTPAPVIKKDQTMFIVNSSAGQWLACELGYFHLGLTADVTALTAAGVAQLNDEGLHTVLLGAQQAKGTGFAGTIPISGSLKVGA